MPAKSVEDALNDQIRMEFASAYQYLAMAAHFEAQNLSGFAHWMRMQHHEEMEHGMRIFNFLLDRGARVELQAIDKPAASLGTPLQVMKQSLKQEQKVTTSIHKLYEKAVEARNYPAQLVLQWFINEQVEEEKVVGDLIARLEMVGDNKAALMIMDRQLAERGSTG